jgi:hypothetical protein
LEKMLIFFAILISGVLSEITRRDSSPIISEDRTTVPGLLIAAAAMLDASPDLRAFVASDPLTAGRLRTMIAQELAGLRYTPQSLVFAFNSLGREWRTGTKFPWRSIAGLPGNGATDIVKITNENIRHALRLSIVKLVAVLIVDTDTRKAFIQELQVILTNLDLRDGITPPPTSRVV